MYLPCFFEKEQVLISYYLIKFMFVIGVESTAHTFGIGIVSQGRILANERHSYATEHDGIIPVEAANHHKKVSQYIYEKALKEAGISEQEITAVAFSQGPGLPPCLNIGRNFSKELALKLKVPLIPVNHCVAHLEIGQSVGAKDPVLLYASGANTQIIAYAAGKYRVFGETLDIGVGNFLDQYARSIGLGFPGGPKIQKLAEQSKKEYIKLPYVVKGMDISFSGILTNAKQKYSSKKYNIEDICYSIQETAFAMLVEVAERAMAHTGKNELVLGGGVACNARLQEMCRIMCRERGAKYFCPANTLLIDNGAMIAYTGEIMLNAGIQIKNKSDIEKIEIKSRQRTDNVNVIWR
jgi:N6-L-threonylcarbamoyladenine synthase